MNDDETSELLQYLRQAVRAESFGDLDQLLVSSRLSDVRRADRQLIAYLEGLRDEIALGSEDAMRQTMARLREIRTDDGRPIQGVVLDVVDEDVAIYGTRRIDLVGSPELDALVRQVDTLLAELRESIDPEGMDQG